MIITGTTTTENGKTVGLKVDIKSHKIENIIKGWVTSIFLGIPLIIIGIILPFKYGEIEINYDPEWYIRMFFVFFGLLALLAPNRVPTIVVEMFDIGKDILIKKTGKED